MDKPLTNVADTKKSRNAFHTHYKGRTWTNTGPHVFGTDGFSREMLGRFMIGCHFVIASSRDARRQVQQLDRFTNAFRTPRRTCDICLFDRRHGDNTGESNASGITRPPVVSTSSGTFYIALCAVSTVRLLVLKSVNQYVDDDAIVTGIRHFQTHTTSKVRQGFPTAKLILMNYIKT